MLRNAVFAIGVWVACGAGTAGAQQGDLDLPLAHPTYEGDPPIDVPVEPDDDLPPTFIGEEIDSENDTIVYVIDVSGSMGWDTQSYTRPDGTVASGTRIERAQAELIRSIRGLSENFRFNVVSYDCSARTWQPAVVDATPPNKASAEAWVAALRPTGATGTGPATAVALSDRENMAVVLLTDGAPNCGANGAAGHRRMIASANAQGASVNVFGIAASGSYRAFCQGVASDNSGVYVDVP
ncbi:MAG: VWA domain-containing protein [Planctomycetota bacterium]